MAFCNEQAKVKLGHTVAYCKPLLCRCWHCETCGPIRAAALRFKARAGSPNTFITLTTNPGAFATPQEAAEALVNAWRLIRRRAEKEAARDPRKRKKPFGAYAPPVHHGGPYGDATRRVELDGKKLPFLAVFEKTKSGWPHLHILAVTKWVDQKWLSAQCAELLKSPIVDVRRVKSVRGAARYVSKYIAKQVEKWGTLKRYYCSLKWDPRPKPEKLPEPLPEVEWKTVQNDWKATLAWLVRHYRGAAARVGPWWRVEQGAREPPDNGDG